MLMVELMIILFHLKLDKFYCIRVMNWSKVTYYDLYFVDIKMSYWFYSKEFLQKAKDRHHNGGGKEKAAE